MLRLRTTFGFSCARHAKRVLAMVVALCFLVLATSEEVAKARHGLSLPANAIVALEGGSSSVDASSVDPASSDKVTGQSSKEKSVKWSADHDCHGCTLVASLPAAPSVALGSVSADANMGKDSLIVGHVLALETPPPKA